MNDFLLGVLAMGFLTSAAFFWRFWQRSQDGLFRLFALAFVILGVNQLGILWFGDNEEHTVKLYAVRLFAFLLILTAIYRKNREQQSVRD
jgi:hypothetical protein